jgi:hypothetical protein
MNVVPDFGKAMIAKSSSQEMSPMTVPFVEIREVIGGIGSNELVASIFCKLLGDIEVAFHNIVLLYPNSVITSVAATRYESAAEVLREG